MPRQGDSGELFRKLTEVAVYAKKTGTILDTTNDQAIVGDGSETTIHLAATTNGADQDLIIISGDGGVELNQINGTPASAMPVLYKPKLAQSVGASVFEAAKIALGKISPQGMDITLAKPLTDILSAIDDGPIAFLEGNLSISFSTGLYGYNGLNFQQIAGYLGAETGAGTTGDPNQAVIGAVNQALLGTAVVRLSGTRFDSKKVIVDLLDCKFEPSGAVNHNRQNPSILPMSGRANKMIVRYPVL